MIQIETLQAPNGDGWALALRRTYDPQTLGAERHPLLIIPGYGMNSFIFGFHPKGVSMEASLALQGFEVFSIDLRGQGQSRLVGRAQHYSFEDLVCKDVAAAVRAVLKHTRTRATKVDLIGCSLGATMMFAYAACEPKAPVGRLVNMGGPVRWVQISPLLRLAFSSPRLVGLLPIRGTRKLASLALPLLKKTPALLSFYLHPDIVDMTQAAELVRTVEDPNRHINRDIAHWIQRKDLIIAGKNISELVPSLRQPLLTVLANADGIVPRETALWPHKHIGSERKDVLEVGTEAMPIAHADMFVSDHAPQIVFEPLAKWLRQ